MRRIRISTAVVIASITILIAVTAYATEIYSKNRTFRVEVSPGFKNVHIALINPHSVRGYIGLTCRTKKGIHLDLPYHSTQKSLINWHVSKKKCYEFTVATWQEEGANGRLRYEMDRIPWRRTK